MKNKKAKSIFKISLILASIGSLAFVPWILVKAWILPLPDSIDQQLEETLNHGFDGMIVYIDQAGKAPEFHTAGWHDRKNKIPAKPNALFKIASISKLYNAVALTKLVVDARLDLKKSLGYYFPELNGRIENAHEITLKMMAQHRSGIPNYTSIGNFWENPPDTREAILDLILDLPANFKPGTQYEYSNSNYLLISMLIEKVVGYSHHQFIKEEILDPLGLKNTFSSLSEIDTMRLMSGYYIGYDEDIKSNDYGSMIATAQDVGVFLRALNEGKLFDQEGQSIYSSIYVFDHGGLLPGYQSLAEYHKDINTVVVQFMNTTDFNGYEWNLSEITINRILKILRKRNKG